MTEGEIITSVRQAKSPKKQIKVVAELNAVTPEEIRQIVGEGIQKSGKKKKPHPIRPWTKIEEDELRDMVQLKLRPREIAEALGRSVGSIQSKISSMGMTRGIYKTKGKSKNETVQL